MHTKFITVQEKPPKTTPDVLTVSQVLERINHSTHSYHIEVPSIPEIHVILSELNLTQYKDTIARVYNLRNKNLKHWLRAIGTHCLIAGLAVEALSFITTGHLLSMHFIYTFAAGLISLTAGSLMKPKVTPRTEIVADHKKYYAFTKDIKDLFSHLKIDIEDPKVQTEFKKVLKKELHLPEETAEYLAISILGGMRVHKITIKESILAPQT